MTAQEFADELFKNVLQALPEARLESKSSISYREARLDRVISQNNVNILISENIPIAVLKRDGAQAVEGKMFDYNPNVVPVNQAAAEVVQWLNAMGGISHWVPVEFRTQALFLSANKVTEGPMFDYVVQSLKALYRLLADMENTYIGMLEQFANAPVDPRYVEDSRLAKQRIEETLAEVRGGRQEVCEVLRWLGQQPEAGNAK